MSNVSSDDRNPHGVPDVRVNEITPTISVRDPLAPVFEKGRLAENISPLVTVKLVALPIAAPADVVKEIVPLHEAAVPLDEALAPLRTLICIVSLDARPTGGKSKVRVAELLVV